MSVHETTADVENEAVDNKNVRVLSTTNESTALGLKHSFPETARVIDHEAERALCRKFDFRLLPILAFMCMSLSILWTIMNADVFLKGCRSVQCSRQRKSW